MIGETYVLVKKLGRVTGKALVNGCAVLVVADDEVLKTSESLHAGFLVVLCIADILPVGSVPGEVKFVCIFFPGRLQGRRFAHACVRFAAWPHNIGEELNHTH